VTKKIKPTLVSEEQTQVKDAADAMSAPNSSIFEAHRTGLCEPSGRRTRVRRFAQAKLAEAGTRRTSKNGLNEEGGARRVS